MESKMPIIVAVLPLVLLMWAEPASAQKQKTYSASVSYHKGLPELTAAEVEKIFADASKLLQKGPNHVDWEDEDVACNVTFTLQGPVRTFPSPDKVFGELDIEELHRVPSDVTGVDFHVKVVEQIMYCRVTLGDFRGCSYPPEYRTINVVHPKKHTDRNGAPLQNFPDHVLWTHEFGHLTGLGHRKSERALMKCGGVTEKSVEVSRRECRCLLWGPGPGSCQLPPARWC
jgi:hypothetical protein